MSELRLNILDALRAIHGVVHGKMADVFVAGLSAEPETIEEFQDAMERFIKPVDNHPCFAGFEKGTNHQPWDAGIIVIDLAARVVATESTYSVPEPRGKVQYHGGGEPTDVWLPYRLTGDWLFLDSVAEYEGISDRRSAERLAVQPLDARPVLFGAITEFVAIQCLAARELCMEDPVPEIHAKWLMTPRDDLRGLSPREVILMKTDDIDLDLRLRELQWSFLNEPAPCLKPESSAYRFAGFGTHSVVIYYNLVRFLITDCWLRVMGEKDISLKDEIARLEQIKTDWLKSPQPDSLGKSPAWILENERKRLPWIATAEDSILDEDCPLCQEMAKELPPGFWHLDGCNMDDAFPFSFCRTRDEWEEEERSRKEMDDQLKRECAQRDAGNYGSH